MSTSTSENPTFSYPDIGVYPASLTVSLPNGQTATVKRKIIIFELITTTFSAEGEACINVQFTDTSSTTETIISWLWDFGDGNFSNLQNPVHTYVAEDDYAVSLTIRTVAGGIGVFTDTVTVVVTDNVVSDFHYLDLDGTVTFSDVSTADSAIISWLWDFGDGNTSTNQNPVHTYGANDSYDVTLTVTSFCGISDDFTDTLVIADVPTPIPMLRKNGANMAIFGNAIAPNHAKLHISNNFNTGSPTWADTNIESLFGGDRPTNFTVDPFSPLYRTGSGHVNGWMLDSTKIWYIEDIFGTPSATLQYTASGLILGAVPSGTTSTGVFASETTQGHAVIAAQKNVTVPGCSGIGVGATVPEKYLLITTDGGATWTLSNAISPVDLNARTIRSIHISKTIPGVVYVAIQDTSTACGLKNTLWTSTDYGATFAYDRDLVVVSNTYSMSTNADDTVLFTSYFTPSKIYKDTSDITQSEAGSDYAATSYDFSLISSGNVVMAANNATKTAYYYSTDGGATWTLNFSVSSAAGSEIGFISIADDDDEAVFAWNNKLVWYSPDFSTAMVGKYGNTGSFENIIGICQG